VRAHGSIAASMAARIDRSIKRSFL
jgi:hypothetical protein